MQHYYIFRIFDKKTKLTKHVISEIKKKIFSIKNIFFLNQGRKKKDLQDRKRFDYFFFFLLF